jgi:hypothetical protein
MSSTSCTTESPSTTSIYFTPESAAARLQTTVGALRARLRRNARRSGRTVVADLGGGIQGIKLGSLWRVIFPTE